jgi:hypothetical protein
VSTSSFSPTSFGWPLLNLQWWKSVEVKDKVCTHSKLDTPEGVNPTQVREDLGGNLVWQLLPNWKGFNKADIWFTSDLRSWIPNFGCHQPELQHDTQLPANFEHQSCTQLFPAKKKVDIERQCTKRLEHMLCL